MASSEGPLYLSSLVVLRRPDVQEVPVEETAPSMAHQSRNDVFAEVHYRPVRKKFKQSTSGNVDAGVCKIGFRVHRLFLETSNPAGLVE
jgi:hypothetical protein